MQRLILSISLFSIVTYANCQITLTLEDMPVVGDNITRFVDTLTTTSQGESGENKIWDFSNSLQHITQTTSCVAPSETPYGNQFGASNIAMTNNQTTYLYFNQNLQKQEVLGFAGDLLQDGNNIVVSFNPTLLIHQFPRTYGSNFNDTYQFDVDVDGSNFGVDRIRLKHKSFITSETDGYGNLITPLGEYNVIRVKTTDNSIDTVFIRLLPFPPIWNVFQTSNTTTVSYAWYAKESKLAAGELTLDSIGNPRRFTYTSIPPSNNVSIETNLSNNAENIHVFPNPALIGQTIQISNLPEKSHYLSILDSKGRVVYQQNISNSLASIKIETQIFSTGIYLYNIKGEKGNILQKGKFMMH